MRVEMETRMGIRLLWRLDTAGDGDRYWGAIGMETGVG